MTEDMFILVMLSVAAASGIAGFWLGYQIGWAKGFDKADSIYAKGRRRS